MKLRDSWSWSAVLFLLAGVLAAPVGAATNPGAPTAVKATPGDGMVTLTWGAPASDGGAPITSYFYQCGASGFHPVSVVYSGLIRGLTNGLWYDCQVWAYNAIGQGAPSNIRGTAIGPPWPLTGLKVAPGNAQAYLSWPLPSTNGGAAITGYKVTSSPGGLSCATTSELSCMMTGLTNGVLYSFTVTATNSVGTSQPSLPVQATMSDRPGAPTGLTATLLTTPVTLPAGSARATWVAPASNGGSAITAYNVTTSPGGMSCKTMALTCDLAGLSPGTSYAFSVTASNTVGTSQAATATLLTPGVPSAPTALKSTPGNGMITLTWGAPASDGGTPVTSYFYKCWNYDVYPGKVVYSGTIGGLTNGTEAVCVVAASNAMGRGAYSYGSATPVASTTTTTTNGWTQIGTGTTFTSASIGSATSYGGIVGGKHYAWNGTSFVADGIALAQVAYGKDGSRWGVGSTGAIYRWSTSWGTVAGALKQISVGNASNVWGVNSTGTMFKWTGTGWTAMTLPVASVSVGADGTVWALNSADSIYRWNGSGWTQIPGALRWISVGSATNVWGVNAGGSVYKFNAAGGWDMPSVPQGTFIGVSTASDGTTLLLRSDGTLWKK